MTKGKGTIAVLGGLVLFVTATDIWFLFDEEPGTTYSSVINGFPWAAGLIGMASVHLVRRRNPPGPTNAGATIAAAVMAVGLSWVLGGGILGLAVGGVLGWFAWGNDRSS